MARIRSIKPDFFSSEQVVSVSPWARLLFQGLWVFGDDEGRGKASALELKAKIFPAESFPASKVESFLQELVRVDLVVLYTIAGVRYWAVPGFTKHQRINRPQESRIPPPPCAAPPSVEPITDRSVIDHEDGVTVHPSRASHPIHSNPIQSVPASEGVQGEPPAAPLAGWGRHLAAVPVGALPEAWRCAEAAFAAWYRQRRKLPWKSSAASGRALRGLAVAVADTAAATGLTEEAVIDRALTNFGADPFAVTSDFPPALLETKWGAYFDPPEIPRPKGAMHPCPPPGAHGNDLADQLGLEVANG